MSDSDSDSLDFSAKDLMPDWVQEIGKPESPKKQAQRGGGSGQRYDDRGGQRDNRGGGRGGDRRGGGGGRDFRGGGGGGGNRDRRGGGGDRRGGGRDRRGGGRNDDRNREPREFIPRDIEVYVRPTKEAVSALSKHIKSTVRAFPLVDVAKMVLGSRERYEVIFQRKKKEGGGNEKPKPFYKCEIDGSLWLSIDEAISHVLRGDAVMEYYVWEEVPVDPPKGAFNTVAVCGMSGTILGPPNHHEYQAKIARIHSTQFSNMSIDQFKSRIQMAKDEETIEKWKTQASSRKQFRLKTAEDRAAEAAKAEVEKAEAEAKKAEKDEKPEADEEVASEPETSDNAAETSPDAETPVAEETTSEPEAVEESAAEEIAAEEEPPSAEEVADEVEAEAEPEVAADADAESEGESDPEPVSEPETAPAEKEEPQLFLTPEALERHFRDNFANDAISPVNKGIVSGDIAGRLLSPPLLNLLKTETEKLRRGFPLPLIQELCRRFEKTGLKFFKRGKKSLHVSLARPRGIGENLNLSERVMKIVNYVGQNSRCKVMDMLAAVAPSAEPREKGETIAQHKLTEDEKNVLADLRWLTLEGYLIEFAGTELVLGKQAPPPPKKKDAKSKKKSASKKVAKKKAAAKKVATEKSEAPADPEPKAPVEEKVESAEPVEAEIKEEEVAPEPAAEAPQPEPAVEAEAPASEETK